MSLFQLESWKINNVIPKSFQKSFLHSDKRSKMPYIHAAVLFRINSFFILYYFLPKISILSIVKYFAKLWNICYCKFLSYLYFCFDTTYNVMQLHGVWSKQDWTALITELLLHIWPRYSYKTCSKLATCFVASHNALSYYKLWKIDVYHKL